MKNSIVFLSMMAFVISSFSQNQLINIHPSVGTEIDKSEKLKYFLYPSIDDSCFISAQYSLMEDSSYIAIYSYRNDSVVKQAISLIELEEVRLFITKFDNYYVYQMEKDSILKAEMDSVFGQGIPAYQAIDNLNKLEESEKYNKALKKSKMNNYYMEKQNLNPNIRTMDQNNENLIRQIHQSPVTNFFR